MSYPPPGDPSGPQYPQQGPQYPPPGQPYGGQYQQPGQPYGQYPQQQPPPAAAPLPAAPPTGKSGKPRLRGRTLLRLALIFGLVGLGLTIAGGVIVAQKSLSKVPHFQRVSVSAGSGTVNLSSGKYVAYYESSAVTRNVKQVPVVPVRLTSPSGARMVLDTLYGGKKVADATGKNDIKQLDYHYDGYDGVAMYQFTITESGRYQVELAQPSDVPDDAKIAFGPSIAAGTAIGAALVVPGILLLLTALILLIVGLVRRRRHKRQLADQALYHPAPLAGPPPGPQWGPQAGQQ